MYRSLLVLWVAMLLSYPLQGQEERKIQISFLPPPLETATYSLGIYNVKTGQLVRHLREGVTQEAFIAGLNGLITNWDGKDNAGKAVPPGKYAARGYAVGALKVEGVDILGNDWAADDENLRLKRVEAITVLPDDAGLGLLAEAVAGPAQVACYGGANTVLRWHKALPVNLGANPALDSPTYSVRAAGDTLIAREGNTEGAYRTGDGAEGMGYDVTMRDQVPGQSAGKDGTVWKIEDGMLLQTSPSGEKLRQLSPKSGEPIPIAVAASQYSDRLYLLEEMPGWQRLRGLSWVETAAENGKPVSTWKTFFERDIRQINPETGLNGSQSPVEISLAENPLDPGKPQKVKLGAAYDDKGSYLTTADGLRLRRISQRSNLSAVRLAKGKAADSLTLFQNDGAAWDEFSIEGARNMMAFDAGEIEMTADGEKTHSEKAAEPPDL